MEPHRDHAFLFDRKGQMRCGLAHGLTDDWGRKGKGILFLVKFYADSSY